MISPNHLPCSKDSLKYSSLSLPLLVLSFPLFFLPTMNSPNPPKADQVTLICTDAYLFSPSIGHN